MIFDFVFSKYVLKKKDYFQWIIDTMVAAGWEHLSKTQTKDLTVMYSKGESGNDKIGIQLREYYGTSTTSTISGTTYGFIGARTFHTYTPNPSPTGVGTFVPNGGWSDCRVMSSAAIDEDVTVYYHVNKDRIILILENADYSDTLSTSICIFGKPYSVAKSDEFSSTAIITSHEYSGGNACRSGIIYNNTETVQHTSYWRWLYPPKGFQNNLQQATDMIIYNPYDGDKYYAENIFITNFDYSNIKTLTSDMRKNTYKDENGYVYKLCVNNLGSNLTSSQIRSFLIRIG